MPNPYLRETIESWVADFCGSPVFLETPHAAKEFAPEILTAFLLRACEVRSREPGELEESDLKEALLTAVAPLELPESTQRHVPDLCGDFLEELERQGRLAGGAQLGAYVRALRDAYRQAGGGKPRPLENPAPKVGRNDPCPCGSGRKYKKCCMNLLRD